MTKEEMLYEDALELIERSMKGEKVNRDALGTATYLLQNAFSFEWSNRVTEAKEAKRWADKIDDL